MADVTIGFDGVYTSFSGADAIVSFNGAQIAEIQAITVNCQREKGPIYVMGTPDPISFSRGKRGIAGNLVFVQFDRNALLEEMEKIALVTGRIPQYSAAGQYATTAMSIPTPVTLANIGNYSGLPLNSQFNQLSTIVQFNAADQLAAAQNPTQNGFVQLHGLQAGEFWTYDDQIPPFDISITLANEYGAAAHLTIEKAEILNFGMGLSIDDINMENANTFVARRFQRIRRGFNTTGTVDTSHPAGASLTVPSAFTSH